MLFNDDNFYRELILSIALNYRPKHKGAAILIGIVLVLGLVSLIFHIFRLDPTLSKLFYDPKLRWFLAENQPWLWLFKYGTIPGLLLTLGCLIGWFASFFISKLRNYRRYFLLIFLTAVIGGGVLVNGLLKDYWGRPRPRQTIEMGGHWEYRQVCEIGTPGRGKSFPCGHCTMGYLFTILFFFRRQNKWIAYLGGGMGVLYGILISTARVVQGAHFVQDTIWSLGILWLVATALHYFVFKGDHKKEEELYEGGVTRRILFGFSIALVVTVIVGSFMTRRPYFRTYDLFFRLRGPSTQLYVKSNFTWEVDQITYEKGLRFPRVGLDAKGFGWSNVFHHFYERTAYNPVLKRNELFLEIHTTGYFSELNHNLRIRIPKRLEGKIQVTFEPSPSLPKLTKEKE